MNSIDIQTTQNVTIAYELATLKDRFLATLIDGAIAMMITLGIIIAASWLVGDVFGEDGSLLMIVRFIPIITFMGYHLISEIVGNGQSWGKKAIGLKVVRLDGAEAGLSDYLLRAVFHIVDTIFSAGVLAALMIASSQRKQRLGDMTANTTVIKLKSEKVTGLNDVLKISTKADYTPVYQDIKHFKEADMLLVKSVITRYRKYPNPAHKEALKLLAKRFSELLELEEIPRNKIQFLETILKDYVVLTR